MNVTMRGTFIERPPVAIALVGAVAAMAVAVLVCRPCAAARRPRPRPRRRRSCSKVTRSRSRPGWCVEPEAISDLARDLGVKTTTSPTPGWANGSYTCTYRYPGGASFVLSVRDLPSTAAAGTYLKGLATTLGRTDQPINLGTEAAFITPNGTAVVQKDHHVLVVDVSGLPPTWLSPPESHSVAAQTIAATIMTCWMGGS